MDCDRMRELIITDFADEEVSQPIKKEIQEHLLVCPKCKEFMISIEKAAIEPFEAAAAETAPEYLWDKIRSSIESEKAAKPLPDIREYIIRLLYPKRIAFALATVAVLMILVNIFVIRPGNEKRQGTINTYLHEEMNSLYSLNGNGEGLLAETEDSGFGTGIEAYFL